MTKSEKIQELATKAIRSAAMKAGGPGGLMKSRGIIAKFISDSNAIINTRSKVNTQKQSSEEK